MLGRPSEWISMRFFISVIRLADRASFIARLITLISLCATPSLAAEGDIERRIALVIGNNAYKESPLINAVNDAEAMAAALSRVGFEVTILKDAPLRVMQETIVEFGNSGRRRHQERRLDALPDDRPRPRHGPDG